MWTCGALLGALFLVAGQVAWWIVDDAADRTWHYAVAAAWFVTDATYVAVMPHWRYRVHRWEATPHAIYTQAGWLKQERRIAPLSRVQTVDLKRGPLEQLFGLATVTVTTASAAGPLEIEGLDLPIARRLVETLTSAAVVEKGDAT
jgi:membrane protein YdbS with pleckstrin-like domain